MTTKWPSLRPGTGGCRRLDAMGMSVGRMNRVAQGPLKGYSPTRQTAVKALGRGGAHVGRIAGDDDVPWIGV